MVTGAADGPGEFITEAAPEDYEGRIGYREDFLGTEQPVPLPGITGRTQKKEILSFMWNGKKEQVLRYEHFSVVMCKSRRLCFLVPSILTARRRLPMARGAWRMDPRIPAAAQIMKECYGNAPKFSRGHMTRREDPIWGAEEATLANADSMHVTNTVPQMQGLNAGIWLSLENYALQNARKDDMRISVFTGPVLTLGDPVMFGVAIPVAFWKVIAFIHDVTGKLCATGYRISQEDFLEGREFVYGAHDTAQVAIGSIETETGLSFGELGALDPFVKSNEGIAMSLRSLHQVQFF